MAQFPALMARAVANREVVMVRRVDGADVDLIAAEELDSLLETAHLLRSPRNAERLLRALERARRESPRPVTLEPVTLDKVRL
ncbi:Antitoxin YefM [Thiorhodovibrio winogradskyi]|uniref:Antitoxin n=1 Tax=Thiorhodovibrio winogradskyi TaxID=77007 RepID=A0ABZ0SCN8_9GAMM